MMNAVALDESGQLSVLDRVPQPSLRPGHVKIRMLAGGICGSDLHALDHSLGTPGEVRVIGHEGGGEIIEVADDVNTLAPGDLVVVEPNYACLTCHWCQQGQTKMCVERTVVSRDTPGLFSEFTVIPAAFAWKLPPHTPLGVIASFEAAMVARVAVRRMSLTRGDSVLVIGAGSQGQAVTQLLLDTGIIPAVLEPNQGKLRAALNAGAREAGTEHDDFDVVFETSGSVPGFLTAIDRAKKLGHICLIGQTDVPIPLVTRPIVQKELTVQGSVIYNHPGDFQEAVRDLEHGAFDPRVNMRLPLSPSDAVQELLSDNQANGKMWIDFSTWRP